MRGSNKSKRTTIFLIRKFVPELNQFSNFEFSKARVIVSSRIINLIDGNEILAPFADVLKHKHLKMVSKWRLGPIVRKDKALF